MSKTTFLSLMLAVAALTIATPSRAGSMRCGSLLVTDGDTAGKLRSRCGEPASISRKTVLRPPILWINGRVNVALEAVAVPVETWEYNFGPNRLIQRVRIEDGLVVAIDTLGYGYP